MKRFLVIIISIIFLNVDSFAQISSFGLQGIKVTDLKIYGDTLYASTRDSGLYRRNLHDTGWVNLGLKNKLLTCIYPHPVDSQGYFLTVGAWIAGSPDSSVIYSLSPDGWVPENISSDLDGILTLNGIESQGMTSIMFAGGSSSSSYSLARRSNVFWEIISEIFMDITDIKISPEGEIWIGGGGGVATVFKSSDKGNTWTFVETLYPEGGWCRDIEFEPFDSNIIYLLMHDFQRSTDGGLNWQRLSTPCWGGQIEIDPFYANHFFLGSEYYRFALFETTNGGLSWDSIPTPVGAQGINDVEINLRDSLELYIATDGTGVYRFVQATNAISNAHSVNEGWNMLSVPNRVHDFCKNTLLPSSISSAFTYENSYINKDTLQNGIGYWSKFNSSNVIKFIGEKMTLDSIDVNIGWNMIGSISYPVRVSSIGSDPPDMIVNDFFTYTDNRYISSDTIQPGHAYWVKTNKSGKLILDTTSSIMTNKLIKIVPNGELPPPPPDYEIQNQKPEIPTKFALEQNYPNPFNPTTNFRFRIADFGFVSLKVYDVLGQVVATLVNEVKQQGEYNVQWDASNFTSGIYFYKLSAGKFIDIKKMILLR